MEGMVISARYLIDGAHLVRQRGQGKRRKGLQKAFLGAFQQPSKLLVAGSIPAGVAIHIFGGRVPLFPAVRAKVE